MPRSKATATTRRRGKWPPSGPEFKHVHHLPLAGGRQAPERHHDFDPAPHRDGEGQPIAKMTLQLQMLARCLVIAAIHSVPLKTLAPVPGLSEAVNG
jgi:hypothetical protein